MSLSRRALSLSLCSFSLIFFGNPWSFLRTCVCLSFSCLRSFSRGAGSVTRAGYLCLLTHWSHRLARHPPRRAAGHRRRSTPASIGGARSACRGRRETYTAVPRRAVGPAQRVWHGPRAFRCRFHGHPHVPHRDGWSASRPSDLCWAQTAGRGCWPLEALDVPARPRDKAVACGTLTTQPALRLGHPKAARGTRSEVRLTLTTKDK